MQVQAQIKGWDYGVLLVLTAHCVGEIAGGRFWPAKPKIEPRGFGFALEHANPSADQRVGLWGLVGVVISVTAHCVGKITRGAGFGLQNRKSNRAGSDLVWNMQIQAQ